MSHTDSPPSIPRMVLGPTLFTLGITLRLAGELRGWPGPWFDQNQRGRGNYLVFAPNFGFYFAWKLCREGQRFDRVNRAFTLALLGMVLNQVVEATALNTHTFPRVLTEHAAGDFVDSGYFQRLLAVSGLASFVQGAHRLRLRRRIPVVVVMYCSLPYAATGVHIMIAHPYPSFLAFGPHSCGSAFSKS